MVDMLEAKPCDIIPRSHSTYVFYSCLDDKSREVAEGLLVGLRATIRDSFSHKKCKPKKSYSRCQLRMSLVACERVLPSIIRNIQMAENLVCVGAVLY